MKRTTRIGCDDCGEEKQTAIGVRGEICKPSGWRWVWLFTNVAPYICWKLVCHECWADWPKEQRSAPTAAHQEEAKSRIGRNR